MFLLSLSQITAGTVFFRSDKLFHTKTVPILNSVPKPGCVMTELIIGLAIIQFAQKRADNDRKKTCTQELTQAGLSVSHCPEPLFTG